MKKLAIALAVICSALSVSAVEYPYVLLRAVDGTETTLSSEGLSLSLADGKLVASHAGGTATFDFASLASMEFSTAPSGVSSIATGDDGCIDAFTTSGIFLGRYDSAAEARRRLAAPGVYILKSKSATSKVIVEK